MLNTMVGVDLAKKVFQVTMVLRQVFRPYFHTSMCRFSSWYLGSPYLLRLSDLYVTKN